jgi:hypothetical protein
MRSNLDKLIKVFGLLSIILLLKIAVDPPYKSGPVALAFTSILRDLLIEVNEEALFVCFL